MSETVAIIILNRNQAQYTRECLASLQQVDYPCFKIQVVDNGSADDSLRHVASEFPNVDFLWLRKNLGVAGGRNAGLRKVLHTGPSYVLFLDNDTFVAPDFLAQLVARMNTDPQIGAVQPKILFADPAGRICSVGGKLYPRISHYRHPGSGQLDATQFQDSKDIDIISGCAGLMRTEVFEKVGLLDETYSPYCHEDVDWSVRLRKANYRLVLEPAAIVKHRVSLQATVNAEKLKQLAKGHMLFLRFHARLFDLPASLLWVGVHMSRRYLFPALARRDWKSAAAVFSGSWAGIRQKRCPIAWPETNCRYIPRANSTSSSLTPEKKILLIGVLGPFDSGPTRVYETILKSRFVEHFQVRFLDLQFARNVGDFERIRPQKFLRLFWYLLQAAYRLAREAHDALCIHLSTNRNAFLKDSLFAWLGFLFGVPVVVLEHGTNIPALYERSGRVMQWFMRATLRRVSRCIVLADCLKFNFEPFLPSERIVSTYLGIDPGSSQSLRSERLVSGDPVTVLFLSTLVESKGILVLLEALPRVLSTCKDVRIVVAGGWGWDAAKMKPAVDHFLSRGDYAESVSFIGPVQGKEKLRVLQTADLFVLPTIVDTAPLVLLEAMRAGLPIVATDVGAIPELVCDGINGLICEKGNAQDLTDKIIYLVKHSTARQQMSQGSRERFENLFTAEKFAGRMIDVFESLFAVTSKEVPVAAVES